MAAVHLDVSQFAHGASPTSVSTVIWRSFAEPTRERAMFTTQSCCIAAER